MKVYVVTYESYDSLSGTTYIEAVFSTKELAQAYINGRVFRMDYEVEEFTLDAMVESIIPK